MEKKISTAEAIIMILMAIFTDLIQLVLYLSVIFAIAAPAVGLLYSGIIQFWMTMKGLRGTYILVNNAGSALFPIKSISVIVLIFMVNNPRVAQIASVAGGKPASGGVAGKLNAPKVKVLDRWEKNDKG